MFLVNGLIISSILCLDIQPIQYGGHYLTQILKSKLKYEHCIYQIMFLTSRAGTRLQKFFMKRCAELELPGLPDFGVQDDEESEVKEAKRPRTSK